MKEIKIGVVGYSGQKFNKDDALLYLQSAFDVISDKYKNYQKTIVSGLTNLGIPGLAYEEAVKRNWKTVGIACSKAKEYELFPVDEQIIIGNEWGDESEEFLSYIDILIRVGGGNQSLKEVDLFKKTNRPVIEFELMSIK